MSRIEIVACDPRWPEQFTELAARLEQQLNQADTAYLHIDHIGSTSVPGLAAKDIIDVQITVASLASERVTETLVALGFTATENARDNLVGHDSGSAELAKRFLLPPSDQRASHIHVRELGRLNQRYPLLFRDYLRADDVARLAYEQIKVELAKRFSDDAHAYYAIKDPHMDTLFRAAQLWEAACKNPATFPLPPSERQPDL